MSKIKAYLGTILLIVLCLAGCGGGSGGPTSSSSSVISSGTTDPRFSKMLDLIEFVGMIDYAEYGRFLNQRELIRLVTVAQLPQEFNAMPWPQYDCIWFSEIAFERYPRLVDLSEILLHELVHLITKEQTHVFVDPICAEFRRRAWEAGLYVDGPPAD